MTISNQEAPPTGEQLNHPKRPINKKLLLGGGFVLALSALIATVTFALTRDATYCPECIYNGSREALDVTLRGDLYPPGDVAFTGSYNSGKFGGSDPINVATLRDGTLIVLAWTTQPVNLAGQAIEIPQVAEGEEKPEVNWKVRIRMSMWKPGETAWRQSNLSLPISAQKATGAGAGGYVGSFSEAIAVFTFAGKTFLLYPDISATADNSLIRYSEVALGADFGSILAEGGSREPYSPPSSVRRVSISESGTLSFSGVTIEGARSEYTFTFDGALKERLRGKIVARPVLLLAAQNEILVQFDTMPNADSESREIDYAICDKQKNVCAEADVDTRMDKYSPNAPLVPGFIPALRAPPKDEAIYSTNPHLQIWGRGLVEKNDLSNDERTNWQAVTGTEPFSPDFNVGKLRVFRPFNFFLNEGSPDTRALVCFSFDPITVEMQNGGGASEFSPTKKVVLVPKGDIATVIPYETSHGSPFRILTLGEKPANGANPQTTRIQQVPHPDDLCKGL